MSDQSGLICDKCKWVCDKSFVTIFQYKTSCQKDCSTELSVEDEEYKFCPFCGKEILLED